MIWTGLSKIGRFVFLSGGCLCPELLVLSYFDWRCDDVDIVRTVIADYLEWPQHIGFFLANTCCTMNDAHFFVLFCGTIVITSLYRFVVSS